MRRSVHPPGALLVLALVMMITMGTAGLVAVSVGLAVASVPIMPMVVGIALILALTNPHRRHRRRLRRAAARPGTGRAMPGPYPGAVRPPMPRRMPPPRPVPPPRPDLQWAHARSRFHALRDAYAAHECDTLSVLRLPALSDVSVPSTARFVDAFAEAQALETDHFPPPPHAIAFAHAVDKAERAWQAARDAAERIRLSGLSADERRTIERVVKLLTTARDSDSDPERHAAYMLARTELDKLDRTGVVHVPRLAKAALDSAARGSLPAA
jgi:hypothetical protein